MVESTIVGGGVLGNRLNEWGGLGGVAVVVHPDGYWRGAFSNVVGRTEIAGQSVDNIERCAAGRRGRFVDNW